MENATDVEGVDDLDEDFDLIDIAYGHLEAAMLSIPPRKLEDMLSDWLKGYVDDDSDESQFDMIQALVQDACLFAPSMSGSTPMDRFSAGMKTADPKSRQALKMLSRSEIRHVRILERLDPDLVEMEDCISRERLVLIDAAYAEASEGLECLMRLGRLESGRAVQINWPFMLTESLKGIIAGYVRPGKGIANPYRCACAVYKHAAREGLIAMPRTDVDEVEADPEKQMAAVAAILDEEWSAGKDDPAVREEFVTELRSAADADMLISYLRLYSFALDGTMPASVDNIREICEVVIETLARPQNFGIVEADGQLAEVQQLVSEYVEQGLFNKECKTLLDNMTAAHGGAG